MARWGARETDAAVCIQAAVRGAQVRHPRPVNQPGSVEAEREIENAKAARIRQLRSDAAEAAKDIAMLRTQQQDEEIHRLRALLREREAAADELRTETDKARERRLRTAPLQQTFPEPESQPESQPELERAVVLSVSGDVCSAEVPARTQSVRYGSAASASWAAAAKLEADVSKIREEERLWAEKDAAARAARQAMEQAEEDALAAAAAAQREAAAKLAALIETVRLEEQEADEAAARATKRSLLEAQAIEAAERIAEAEAEAAVELARERAAALALRTKEEELYQAERAAAEEREAAIRAAEDLEFEAAKARAVEREIAKHAALMRIAGSTGFEQRRHLTHTTMRMNSPKLSPRNGLVLSTPTQGASQNSAESRRRTALQDAEHRLNSLQKHLEAEKSELRKEVSDDLNIGTKTEGTPPCASYTDSSLPAATQLHQISQHLDDADALSMQLCTPADTRYSAAPSDERACPEEAINTWKVSSGSTMGDDTEKNAFAELEVQQSDTAAHAEADHRRLTSQDVQTKCKVAITRARSHLSTGAYVAAAAGFEEVVHVFRSYVVTLPLPDECSSETVTIAKLYAQAQPLGLNQKEVDEVLDAFRTIAVTLERHGLSESSVARVKQQLDEANTRTAGELSAYLTHDPAQQSLQDYRAAVTGLAEIESTIAAGEQSAVRQRSTFIDALKSGLARVEHRAEDQGKAAGIILCEEAQPVRAVLQRLEETISINLPRAWSPSDFTHERAVRISGFPGEWRRCPICTLENPCSEHSALQQRSHQLGQLTQLLQAEDVQAAVAHAKATARSRQALLEQKRREEREAAEAEVQRAAAEAARQAAEVAKRARRVYYQVQVICAEHLSSAAARSSWTCMKKLRSSLDPHCELLICDAGGLVSKPVQWTPTRHMTFSPNWGRRARWMRNSKRGWDLWRHLCCGGDTARNVCRRLLHNTTSNTVFPSWAAADALIPDEDPTVEKRGLWYCPSAIRVLGGEDGAIPQKAVTVRVWDHNRGYRKKADVDASADANCQCTGRYEKISDMLCGTARLEIPHAWEQLLSLQKAADDAVRAEEDRLEREAILKDPYSVKSRNKRRQVSSAEDDQRRRESFRGGVLTVPLCDAEGPLLGDDGEVSTITVNISIWTAPEPGRLWWQEMLKCLYVPCLALVGALGVALTALAAWLLVRPAMRDCWEANLPSTADLFGEELSRCQLDAPTAVVDSTNKYVSLRWPAVYGAAGYRIQEWSWQQLQTDWYDARRQDDSFSFLYNYGGAELPSCGTAHLIPQSLCKGRVCEIFLTGRADLDVEWRYQAVKEATGETSRWSPPSNRMELPPGLLSVPFDTAALRDPQWEPAPLALPNTCCPVGLYTAADDVGTERCTFCPAGYSSANGARGQTSCEICPAGRYASPAKAAKSSAAAAARFAKNEDSGSDGAMDGLVCTPCGFNTFSSSPGAAVCEKCSLGWVSFHGAESCWIWFPFPILVAVAVCVGVFRRRRRRRNELGRKYLSAWLSRTMTGPISSWWRGDELGRTKSVQSSTAIVSHGRDAHAARAVAEAAEVGVRAAAGLAKRHADNQPKQTEQIAAKTDVKRFALESPTSVLDSPISTRDPTSQPSLTAETDEHKRRAGDAKRASYRRFDERNVHQIYAHGSEFAAHAALWRSEETKGIGTPRGKSGTGLLSAAVVQDELRQVLLRATEQAGEAWNEEDREECRVNFEMIAKDAESSQTGVSWTELGSSVTAVLERLPASNQTLARTEPPSPGTAEATTHGLAVVNVLPAPEGMEWMIEKQKAAKMAKEAAEAAALRAKQVADALAKVERHAQQQHSMVAADGKLGPLQHRSSANWVKRVAKDLQDAEAAAAAVKEAERLAAEEEATRRAQEAATAVAKVKADAEADAARRAAQAEVPIRVAKLHSQIDQQRAVAARVARASGSANAVGVLAALEAAASQASLPELELRPHVRNAWADSDSTGSSSDSEDSYTVSEDSDDASSGSGSPTSARKDPVVAAIASSLSGIRASRALRRFPDAP